MDLGARLLFQYDVVRDNLAKDDRGVPKDLNTFFTSAGAAGSVSGMDIYMYTETGVVLAATVGGTKYWKDKDLN